MATANLLDAAEDYLHSTPLRRCAICHDGTDEVREAVARLRARGCSALKIARFLAETADSHGHGIRQSPASVQHHLDAHLDRSRYAAPQATGKPRRRG